MARRHRDQQAAIVGAEIERGEHRQFLHRRPAVLRPGRYRRRRGFGRTGDRRDTGGWRRCLRGRIVVAGENLAAAPALAPFS
ncbi:hypothetical protein GCM10007880_45530 [Mesorhizobium amorphae]|nr:hypothetical protein GCM10007880_45530 [Mesorhizobium amorphae]